MSEEIDQIRASTLQIERDVNRIKNDAEIKELLQETLKEIKQINSFTTTVSYFLWGGAGYLTILSIVNFLR